MRWRRAVLSFWRPFNFCKTQVQTKTSRVIPRASGKQYLQRLLTGAEIFKTGSQWRPRIKFDVQSQPRVTGHRASSIPPATAELAWSISAEVVASAYLPGFLAEGIVCGGRNLRTSPAWLGSEPWWPCLHKAPPSTAEGSCCGSLLAWGESIRHGRTLSWVSWERGVWYCRYCYSVCLLSPIL